MKMQELIESIQQQVFTFGRNAGSSLLPEEYIVIKAVLAISQDVNVAEPLQHSQLLSDLHHAFQNSAEIDSDLIKPVFETLHHAFGAYLNLNKEFTEKYIGINQAGQKILKTPFEDFLLALKREVLKVNADHTDNYQKNPKHKSIGDYTARGDLSKERDNSFSHSVRIMHKRKNGKRYYAKLCADKITAMREVVAQEFSRLILPHHPKTRLAKKTDEGKVWVLSEEIAGAVSLNKMDPEELRMGLLAGTITGLGGTQVVNLAKKETDPHLGNVMITPEGKIFGIDGDWSFADLAEPTRFDKKLTITEKDIANLPFVNDYKPYNWLDIIIHGQINPDYINAPDKQIFTADLRDALDFRQEINESMLKMLILPQSVIKLFVSSYMRDHDQINLLVAHINDQLVDLRKAALNNASFKAYMQTDEAKLYFRKCVTEYVNFIPMKKAYLLPDDSSKYIKEMDYHFNNLLPIKNQVKLPGIILPPIKFKPQIIEPTKASPSRVGMFKITGVKEKKDNAPVVLPPVIKPKA